MSPSRRLTEGPIGRTLLFFALPTLASSVLQSANASINAAWVGRLLGKSALAATANAHSILFLLLGAVFGLSMAATLLVGQSIGARDLPRAKRTIGTAVTFFGALSLIMAVAGALLAPAILRGMGTPPDAMPLAAAYLRVIFLGFPPIVLFSFLSMALRGGGDARTPFFFLLLSVVLDTGLNPLFIRGLGPLPALGISGSALASLVAQWVTLLAMVAFLYTTKSTLRLERTELGYLQIDGKLLGALVKNGVPMGLSVIVVSSSMFAMMTLVNQYGSEVTSAYGACLQLWNYIQMPAFALGSAVSAMAAQNVGAKLWDRVRTVARFGILYNVVMTAALVGVVALLDRSAFVLFLGDEAGAVEIAHHANTVVSWSFILFGVSFVLSSVVRSTGAAMPPLLILVFSLWVVRIPFAHYLTPRMHAEAIWWSFPVGSAVSVIATTLYYRFGHWQKARLA
jgi:putative MATE family efflux protein